MNKSYCLSDIKPGESVRVKELVAEGNLRRRFLDIGLVKDTRVECLGKSPSGDPGAYLIRGAVIAIRDQDCQGILVY